MRKKMNKAAASRIQSSEAKVNQGKTTKNSFASRAQSAADTSSEAPQKDVGKGKGHDVSPRERGWYMHGEIYHGIEALKEAVTTAKPASTDELVIEGESIFRRKIDDSSTVRKLLSANPGVNEVGRRAFIELTIFRTSSFKLATRVLIAPDESLGSHFINNDFDFQSKQDKHSYAYISIPPEGSRVLVMECAYDALFLDEFQSLCGWLGLPNLDSDELKRQIAGAGGFLGGVKYIS